MKAKVKITNTTEMNFRPESYYRLRYKDGHTETVKALRVVESPNNLYVVFENGTWRPVTTYGKTWF